MADINWWSTYLGDEETAAVNEALRAKRFSQSQVTADLERKIAERLGVGHAVLTVSGSMGLLLGLIALGIGRDDEVIVPDVTWIATAHAPWLLGARPVLAESRADRPVMDLASVERLITDRTRAIVPVHLNGRAVDMKGLLELANGRGIPVMEDAAQALGSRHAGRYLGTFGRLGIYSLSLTKLVSTGQGGVVVTDDDALYRRLQSARVHGVANYGGEEHYEGPGFNFKFNDLQAAVGMAQFDRLDAKIAHVTAVYRRYRDGLRGAKGFSLIPVDVEAGEVPLWTEILCDDRRAVVAHLDARGIGTRPYHPALHTAAHLGAGADNPNARLYGERGLVLPSGPSQPLEAVDRTIAALGEYAA
jgi:dTDP-4-amino-4,6-dideoxygalactose transaminase